MRAEVKRSDAFIEEESSAYSDARESLEESIADKKFEKSKTQKE